MGNAATAGMVSRSTRIAGECPACEGTRFEQRRILPTIAFDRCLDCGLLISSITRSAAVEAEFSRVVPGRYERGLLAVREAQGAQLLSLIRAGSPDARTLIDVGCSFGRFLHRARAAGFAVRGIEPDPLAVAEARATLGEAVVRQGLLTVDSFPPASADVLTTLDVLEHVPVASMGSFVSAIRSVIRPGGIWVVKVPTSDGPYFRVAHALRRMAPGLLRGVLERLWQSRYEYPHTVYFNASALSRLATRHGFVVETVAYLDEVPNRTIIDRLRYDDSLSAWQSIVLAPGLLAINLAGRLFRRTDSMVMIARRVDA